MQVYFGKRLQHCELLPMPDFYMKYGFIATGEYAFMATGAQGSMMYLPLRANTNQFRKRAAGGYQ